ncbi:MAG: tetratricopeptide repeat protein [bacterium]
MIIERLKSGMTSFVATSIRGWILALLLGAGLTGMAAQQESQSIMAFADDLLSRGDYYRAITEYERFIFLNPEASQAARARFQVGMCYYRGGKWDAACDQFLRMKEQFGLSPEARDAWLMLATTYYRLQKYAMAEDVIEEFVAKFPDDERVGDALIMKGICLVRLGRPQWAAEWFGKVPTNSVRHADVELLQEMTKRLEAVHGKNPGLAGGLSAVIPGAGQLYNERPRDAAVSFLINGVTIAGMLSAFHNHEEVVGCLFAVFESSWYFGNIYNAAMGAQKYNTRKRNALFDQLEVNCGLLKETQSGRMLPGVGIKIKF